jgi:ketosteroid isomerase-like protein
LRATTRPHATTSYANRQRARATAKPSAASNDSSSAPSSAHSKRAPPHIGATHAHPSVSSPDGATGENALERRKPLSWRDQPESLFEVSRSRPRYVVRVGSADDNRRAVREAFLPWEQGDSGPFFDLVADDVRWTVIGSTPASGVYQSKQALISRAFGPLLQRLGGRLVTRLVDIRGRRQGVPSAREQRRHLRAALHTSRCTASR